MVFKNSTFLRKLFAFFGAKPENFHELFGGEICIF